MKALFVCIIVCTVVNTIIFFAIERPDLNRCNTLEIQATPESALEVQGSTLLVHAPGAIKCAKLWKQGQPQSPAAQLQ